MPFIKGKVYGKIHQHFAPLEGQNSEESMKYAYENLGEDQFENLVVCISREIFGIGAQAFAKGPDGGRDAKFIGTSQFFPSTASPWVGTTIIQAKHVNAYNKSFSDQDFYGNQKSVLGDELPKIKKLRQQGELDNYILFSNRKLTATTESKLKNVIASECSLPHESIALQDVHAIEAILKIFPRIVESANIDPVDSPLGASPDELAEVIDAFAAHMSIAKDVIIAPPTERISLESKNKLNSMSKEYSAELSRRHLKDVGTVRLFLGLPENDFVREKFQSAVDEFQSEIIAKRKDYQSFDNVLQALKTILVGRDEVLRKNKRLTELLLFYMYWDCDIGKKTEEDNDTSN